MIIHVLPFLNNPKDLELSYRTDLDFWDCFRRKKNSVLKDRNTVDFIISQTARCSKVNNIQSTLVISKSKGPSETLRDIRT